MYMLYFTCTVICIDMYMFCIVLYCIAGNIGGKKTLAVWQCKLKFVNIKSIKLKIRYTTTCDCHHVEVLQKMKRNNTA